MINAEIPLSIRPPQFDNPLDSASKALVMRHLMLQNQTSQDAFEQEQKLRALYQASGGDADKLQGLLLSGGFGKEALAADKERLLTKKTGAEIQDTQGKVQKQFQDLEAAHANAILNAPPQDVANVYQQARQESIAAGVPGADKSPPEWNESLRPLIQAHQAKGLTADQQLQLNKPQSELGKTTADLTRMQGNPLGGQSGQPLVSPEMGKIAIWKAAGGHVPEGQVPYVDTDGTVKTKTDPNWLQAKNEIAKNSATVVNNNIGTKSFNEKFGALQAGQIEAEQKKAQTASDTIMTMHKVRDAVDSGVYTGGKAADVKLAVTQILTGFHVPLPQTWKDASVNSQEFKSFVGAQLLQHAKDLGTNPSNADATRIDNIIGKLGTDPKALTDIIDFNEAMARKAIDRFNGHLTEAQKNAQSSGDGNYGFDMSIAQPPEWKSSKPPSKISTPKPPTASNAKPQIGNVPVQPAPEATALPVSAPAAGTRILQKGEKYQSNGGHDTQANGGEVYSIEDGRPFVFPDQQSYDNWQRVKNGKPTKP